MRVNIVHHLACIVDILQKAQLSHSDLTASNLFVSSSGQLKLGNFLYVCTTQPSGEVSGQQGGVDPICPTGDKGAAVRAWSPATYHSHELARTVHATALVDYHSMVFIAMDVLYGASSAVVQVAKEQRKFEIPHSMILPDDLSILAALPEFPNFVSNLLRNNTLFSLKALMNSCQQVVPLCPLTLTNE